LEDVFLVLFCTRESIPIHKAFGNKNKGCIGFFNENDQTKLKNTVPTELTSPLIGGILKEIIEKYDNTFYELLYYCIMHNHVHLVIDTGFRKDPEPLHKIMKLIKGSSSRAINLILNQSGPLWQKDSYDHLIRNDKELGEIGDYIIENPVKAGKVAKWQDWPYTYVKYI
jgi:REP element-mobilizing transposase RayT